MSGWKSMESAPRDGSAFVAYGTVVTSEAGYEREIRTGFIVISWVGEGWGPWQLEDVSRMIVKPYSWLPLAAPQDRYIEVV